AAEGQYGRCSLASDVDAVRVVVDRRITVSRSGIHQDHGAGGKYVAVELGILDDQFATTASRDSARAAGADAAPANHPFGSKEALVNWTLGQCFGMWNQRVEEAFETAAGLGTTRSAGGHFACGNRFLRRPEVVGACVRRVVCAGIEVTGAAGTVSGGI